MTEEVTPRQNNSIRKCYKCLRTRPMDEFCHDKRSAGKRTNQCKDCRRAYQKQWRAANQEKMRASRRKNHLRKQYNLTPEQYDELGEIQSGICAICTKSTTPLYVDHDHKTGSVRGLLCQHCNSGLGFFEDDPDLLKYAIAYLLKQPVEVRVGTG